MGGGNQVDQLLIAQKVGADLSYPGELGLSIDDVSEQRFCAFDIDGEVVVYEKDYNLAAIRAGVLFESQHFVNHALIRTKPN